MAEKTLKSLNFGSGDTYFPLPIVTADDNDKVLMVVGGEWEATSIVKEGTYAWKKYDANMNLVGFVVTDSGNTYVDSGAAGEYIMADDGHYYELFARV